jgi:hypothetical protein
MKGQTRKAQRATIDSMLELFTRVESINAREQSKLQATQRADAKRIADAEPARLAAELELSEAAKAEMIARAMTIGVLKDRQR